jgi:hypothetical protein
MTCVSVRLTLGFWYDLKRFMYPYLLAKSVVDTDLVGFETSSRIRKNHSGSGQLRIRKMRSK